jgi:hypothetical protein
MSATGTVCAASWPLCNAAFSQQIFQIDSTAALSADPAHDQQNAAGKMRLTGNTLGKPIRVGWFFRTRCPSHVLSERVNHDAILYPAGRAGRHSDDHAAICRRRPVLSSSFQLCTASLLCTSTSLLHSGSRMLYPGTRLLSSSTHLPVGRTVCS